MQGEEWSSGSVYGVVFRKVPTLLTELMMTQHYYHFPHLHVVGIGRVGQWMLVMEVGQI